MRKMTRIKQVREENGMALVLTLMAVSILVAITVQLATSVSWQMQGAANLRDSIQLDAINRSGLNLIRAALAVDFKENQHDSKHDSWGKLIKEDAPQIFGAGKLDLDIVDLSGLLQVNSLVPAEKDKTKFEAQQKKQVALWKQFLTSGKFDLDDDEADALIDALIDWIDENDDERDHGAESGYYLSLSPPYKAGNSAIKYIEELLLIRGMTKDLFYGNDEYLPLGKFLTVAGRDGKININTAPVEVLMVLDGNMSEQAAAELIEFREDEDHKTQLANPKWYLQVNSSIELNMDFAEIKSQYFQIKVVATHNRLERSGMGILERDREKGTQALLYWEVR